MLRAHLTSLVLIALALGVGAPNASASAQTRLANQVLRQVNAARQSNGVAPLTPSRALRRSSRRYARRMVRENFFAHLSQLPISRRYHARGEVLEFTRRGRPKDVVRAWLRSPAHRAVLLDPKFREGGFGRALGTIRAGGHRGAAWVGHVGTR